MAGINKVFMFTVFILLGLSLVLACLSCAAVVVYDNVTTRHTPVFLKTRTKGSLFPEGGRLVVYYVDEKNIGKTLSGGDGYGYLKYEPRSIGLKEVMVHSDGDTSAGRLLVMGRKEKALIIEIESALRKSLAIDASRDSSEQALEALSKKYRIIYLSTFLGTTFSRKCLAAKGFPEAVVLDWQGSQTFRALQKRQVTLYGIVGSPKLVEEASGHIAHRYAFEKTPHAKILNNWQDAMTLLEAEDRRKAPQRPEKPRSGEKRKTSSAPSF